MKDAGFAVFIPLWLLIVGSAYYYQAEDDKQYADKIAYKQAEMFFHHILLMREWNARHGGVYAPVTAQNPPDPNLQTNESTIIASNVGELTLIAPGYMTQQLAELEHGHSGIQFHITRLEPSLPENTVDEWERTALHALQNGRSEYKSLSDIGGVAYYRYMAPLESEQNCSTCPPAGNLRSGISVSIPAANIDSFVADRIERLKRAHLLIAAAGLVAVLFAYWTQSRLNKRLHKAKSHLQLAYLDALTLLPNRRYYDAFLRKEWKRAARHGYPLSMIMIDIDFFKAYNDSLGHAEGDQCLRTVAKTLRRFFRRSGDLIARYGGEEFCVVAACDNEQIYQLAEVMRQAVESMHLPHPDPKISAYVTISLGVATLIPKEDRNCADLMLYADQALYTAKHSGRNQVAKYAGYEPCKPLTTQ